MCYLKPLSVAFVSFLYFSQVSLSSSEFVERSDYSVIVNAGPLHTTLTIYNFFYDYKNRFHLRNIHSETISPGLRSYAKRPEQCIRGISELLRNAVFRIPRSQIPDTPLRLIALGLKYLPNNQTAELLSVVRRYFNTSGFLVEPDSVSLMNGRKKVYLWMALNLIQGGLKDDHWPLMASLDLDSGPSHVAFAPLDMSQLTREQLAYVVNVTAFRRTFKVFALSHYGLGITEARLQILEEDRTNKTGVYKSACIHPQIVASWHLKDKQIILQGADSNDTSQGVNFTACLEKVKMVVNKYQRAPDMSKIDIFATSFYYQAMVEGGIITTQNNSVTMTVNDVRTNAKRLCQLSDLSHPFVCMDMVYINVLLRRIYRVKRETFVRFIKAFDDTPLSWTLGAAFEFYDRRINSRNRNKVVRFK